MSEAQVTSVQAFKKKKAQDPLELPSGAVMLCRRAGMQTFLSAGIIPNSLMATVQSAIAKGQAPETAVNIDDMDNIDEFVQLIDNVVIFCAVEPPVHENPKKSQPRDEELLYVDEIDDEDKMFIFQWATGGTRDIEQFRREAGSSLEAVRAGAALEDKPKQAAKRKR